VTGQRARPGPERAEECRVGLGIIRNSALRPGTGHPQPGLSNADLAKTTPVKEVLAFCDHWKELSGHDPHPVVMDQKVTTHPALGCARLVSSAT